MREGGAAGRPGAAESKKLHDGRELRYTNNMNAKEFWERYVGEYTPAEFMSRYQSRNPRRCAERYVSRLPSMYGIVRQRTWRKTFLAPVQHVRDSVVAGLTAYLEQTRPEWEQALAERAEREQADWERAQQQSEPPAPVPAEGGIEAAPPVEPPAVSAAPPVVAAPPVSPAPAASETQPLAGPVQTQNTP